MKIALAVVWVSFATALALSAAAERVKSNLLTTLQLRDEWSVPILLNLEPAQANLPELPPVALNFSQTGAGLKIQVDLLLGSDFAPETLEREVMCALLLEMSYRSTPQLAAGQPYVSPPEWLVEGLRIYHREPPEVLDALQSAAAVPPPLEQVLAQKWALLDPTSRTLFRGYAAALVTWLLERDGGKSMSAYIRALPESSADPLSDLAKYFPDCARQEQWQAALTRLARESAFVILTYRETTERLDELLHTKIGVAADGKTALELAASFHAVKPKIDRAAAREVTEQLALLGAIAHPLLHPVVDQYQQMVAMIARKTAPRRLVRRFEKTNALRAAIAQRMDEVDWFEATQLKTASGAFQSYFDAAQPPEFAPRRDRISVYLDAMENQYP